MATSEDAGALWKLVAKTAAALLTTASAGVLFHGYWNHARKANIMRRAKRVTNKDEAIAALGSTALRPLGVLVKVSGTAVTQSPLTSGVSGMPVRSPSAPLVLTLFLPFFAAGGHLQRQRRRASHYRP